MEVPQEPSQDNEDYTLGLNWRIPEGIVSKYVTNILIQETPHEYIVMFFEAHPPVLLSEADLEAQRREKPKIDAECVARIIVSRKRLKDFVDVLQRAVNEE